jgi:hypothetical protein
MDLILDTSIIIEIFGGNERVREHLKNQGNKVHADGPKFRELGKRLEGLKEKHYRNAISSTCIKKNITKIQIAQGTRFI